MSDSKRKNQKLQVIDLTDETFEFDDKGFTLAGFIANDGRKWLSAEIACHNLALGNVSQAISSLPYKDKAIIIINRDNDNRGVRHIMVTMAGLFRLIFKSRTEKAEEYQEWVFSEVLPSIYIKGGYIAPNATSDQILRLLDEANQRIEDLEDLLHIEAQRHEIESKVDETLPDSEWENDDESE